jgi:GST-like protein
MITLYGARGCGSAAVEAVLALSGVDYELIEASPWERGPGYEALCRISALPRIPTLVLGDGTIVTESAAILAWIVERGGAHALGARDDATRAIELRWIVFLACNVYNAISIRDFPARWVAGEAAQRDLVEHGLVRLREAWSVMAASLAPAPYLTGARMSALDVYAAMMSHWSQTRAWLREVHPHIDAALALTERDATVAQVWARHFDDVAAQSADPNP